MGEPGRLQALRQWWRDLPTAWRVNAALYLLAGLSLVALLAQVVTGGDSKPRRVQVASRPQAGPTTSTPLGTSTTALPATTVEGPTTIAPPAATVAPKAAFASATTRPRAAAGKPAPAPAPAPGNGAGAAPAPPGPVCHNSTDPACGVFFWDPPSGGNAPISIAVTVTPNTLAPSVGQEVVFQVNVVDPDHAVTGNCSRVAYGDGSAPDGQPCRPAPCLEAHGPWAPPAKEAGGRNFTFRHTYTSPGNFTAELTFQTDADRCPDPYGNGPTTARIPLTVTP
jgi:hypothetical protein